MNYAGGVKKGNKSLKLPVVLNDEERKMLLKQTNVRYITGQRNRVMRS